MKIIIQQFQMYYRVILNYNKMCTNKSILFYIYTLPPIGYFLYYLFIKFILKSKNIKIINKILKFKIFKICIRFFNPDERYFLSNNLDEYNNLDFENNQNDLLVNDKIKELKENGYCSIGKIFSNEDCLNFIQYLENKDCYLSQVPLQSDGKKHKFNLSNFKKQFESYPYIVFLPELISFMPIQNFLSSKNLINIVNSYLNFKWTIFSCITWFNPSSKKKHYVHRFHRDHDDYKALTMFIYWTDVDNDNGSFKYVAQSHKSKSSNQNKISLNGLRGNVFLADTSGLHCASQIIKNYRIITQIRFGKKDGYSPVVDGYCQSPSDEQLKFIKTNF